MVNLDLANTEQELVKLKKSNKVEHFEGCKRHGDVRTRGRDWGFVGGDCSEWCEVEGGLDQY
jgi:hypothetical protein